jgi:nucleotide-binding universal stress UspA family protein
MYSRIVVGYDGRDPARDALTLGSLLAQATGASLLVAYVSDEQPRWYRTQREYQRVRRDEVNAILEPALEALPDSVDAGKASLASTSATRGLHDLAAEEHANLLVLGSTHHGPIGRVLIGSVGELLLMGAPCAVTVAPKGFATRAADTIDVVGVGFDGSPEAELAVQSAHALAKALGALLRAISVVEPQRHGPAAARLRKHDDRHDLLQQRLDETIERLPESADVERALLEGIPSDSLADAMTETDVLVVGSRGYGPLHHVLLGSVSAKLMRAAPCPMLVVPRGAPSPAEDLRTAASTSS